MTAYMFPVHRRELQLLSWDACEYLLSPQSLQGKRNDIDLVSYVRARILSLEQGKCVVAVQQDMASYTSALKATADPANVVEVAAVFCK